MKYSIAYIKRNDIGQVVENRDLRFTPGSKRLGKIVPAYYETTDKDEIEYLKRYPNYGVTYKMEGEKEAKKPELKVSTKKEEVNEPEEEVNFDEEDDSETKEFPEISTVQQAGLKLKQVNPKLKTADVNNREKVDAQAKELNVVFPNLK